MRVEDVQEVWHSARISPLKALLIGLVESSQCFTAEVDGLGVVCIFGVTPMEEEGTGSVWMLGSTNLNKVKKTFIKECSPCLELLFNGYNKLCNYVWKKNVVHIRWLKWLGFSLMKTFYIGEDSEPFVYFERIKGV